MSETSQHSEEEQQRVVIRDRRRIDPQTGEVRPPVESGDQPAPGEPTAAGGDQSAAGELDALRAQLDERTADLQRVTAEYANYRKRVERDREVVIAVAKAQVVGDLLAVLDDLERAEVHGDLTGAFKSVADKLIATLNRAGLEPFGHEGEPFDPLVHEAVQHTTSPEVSEPTVTAVLRRGYRFGDRVLRPALVGVTDHEPGADLVAEPAGNGVANGAEQKVDEPVGRDSAGNDN